MECKQKNMVVKTKFNGISHLIVHRRLKHTFENVENAVEKKGWLQNEVTCTITSNKWNSLHSGRRATCDPHTNPLFR